MTDEYDRRPSNETPAASTDPDGDVGIDDAYDAQGAFEPVEAHLDDGGAIDDFDDRGDDETAPYDETPPERASAYGDDDDFDDGTRRRPWALIGVAGVIAAAVIGYAILLFVMAANQNALIFRPEASSGQPADAGLFAAEARVTTEDGLQLNGWYRGPGRGAPTVLFLHGNSGSLPDYADRMRAYLDAGFGLLAIDYRGFGASPGEPSLDGLILDARAGLEFLNARGIDASSVFVHGFSMGGMPATALAAEADLGGLVLEASFADIARVASERYWFLIPALVAPLIDGGVDPIDAMESVDEPVFVMHGTRDAVTPPSDGQALYEAAANKGALLLVEGGTHRSLLEDGAYDDAIAFIRETMSE